MRMISNNKKQLGLYIHIPFCISKCVYCDFLSGPADDCVKGRYVQALIEEIRQTVKKINAEHVMDYVPKQGADIDQNRCSNYVQSEYIVETVFFGGGTPSCISAEYIRDIMDELKRKFVFSDSCEVTIECNPGTLDHKKADLYRSCGINRISFGLQSADNTELKMLGRIHTFEQFKESLETARKAGFDNINVDIMSALPGQTIESFHNTLRKVVDCGVEHISAYSLIIEEGTVLYDRLDDYPDLPNEDDERQMYYDTEEYLAESGFEHYEISNYAKKGRVCRHNLSYWERKDYLGFGVGAASLFEEKRHTNRSDMEEYMNTMLGSKASNAQMSSEENSAMPGFEADDVDVHKTEHENLLGHIWEECHELSVEEQMEEFMFLGLRKIKGIDRKDFCELFHRNIVDVYGRVIQDNIEKGLLRLEGDALMLTDRGIDISNVVMAEFLLDE